MILSNMVRGNWWSPTIILVDNVMSAEESVLLSGGLSMEDLGKLEPLLLWKSYLEEPFPIQNIWKKHVEKVMIEKGCLHTPK